MEMYHAQEEKNVEGLSVNKQKLLFVSKVSIKSPRALWETEPQRWLVPLKSPNKSCGDGGCETKVYCSENWSFFLGGI